MRSHIEFRSEALLRADDDDDEPHGEKVARLLAGKLPEHGYEIVAIAPEDWSLRVDLKKETFPLWIGCAHYEEYPDGHLCFIEPSKPYVRRWLKRVSTSGMTEPLATAIEQVLRADAQITDIRWWTATEVNLGRG